MIYFSDLLTILRQFLESIFANLVGSHIGFATKNEYTKSRPFNKPDISIGSTYSGFYQNQLLVDVVAHFCRHVP